MLIEFLKVSTDPKAKDHDDKDNSTKIYLCIVNILNTFIIVQKKFSREATHS